MLKLQIKLKTEARLNNVEHLPRVIQILSVFGQPHFAKGNGSHLLYCTMWDPKMLIFNAKLISVLFAKELILPSPKDQNTHYCRDIKEIKICTIHPGNCFQL